LIKSKYRWVMPNPEAGLAERLSTEFGVGKLVAGVLAARGWEASDETAAFLEPTAEGLLDPFEMKGMAAAVDRIRRAARDGERIRVYGDYDADGVTSTALMTRLLAELGADYDTYIPHRSREGYGLNVGAIDAAAEAGVRLLVTVDNGISAVEQIAHAASLGIDVVVTDHHEPPETLPTAAVALVNPKQKDCPYPFKGLCGAGVVFKLAHAMLGRPVLEYADLAAIGTIADLMPLTGENRIIARLGLEQLRTRPVPGIRALAKAAGLKTEELSSGRIGFSIAPRLNAGGRLDTADGAVKLLTAASEQEAEAYALNLDRLNTERQELVERTFAEADARLTEMLLAEEDGAGRVIVLAAEGWNAGIAGLVASKLVERYYRPAFVLAIDPETGFAKGSARSIDGFDLYAALTDCAELMEHYGGHQAAAGLTIRRERIPELARRLDGIAEDRIAAEDWTPKKKADLAVDLREATTQAIDRLASLEPFGNGNPTPRVVIREATVRESRTMGKEDKHLRVTVEQSGLAMEVVAFGMGSHRNRFAPGLRVDLLGELTVNEWNGNRKPQMLLHDYRSDALALNDLRGERDPMAALERLASAVGDELAVVCGSRRSYLEAVARLGDSGVAFGAYGRPEPSAGSSGIIGSPASEETAAALEGIGFRRRHLALIGLPQEEQHVGVLKRWLSPEQELERLTVFSDPYAESRAAGAGEKPFPDRKQFGEAYALCRKKGKWLDAPDGFLQESAQTLSWPLATVRMMHEVFLELGFIAAEGSARKIVSEAPKRELAESARYRKAQEQWAERSLERMPAEELRRWADACRAGRP